MLITILSIVILLVGIFTSIIFCFGNCDWLCVPSAFSVVSGGVGTLVSIIIILFVQMNCEIDYVNALIEKQAIEYRIEQVDLRSIGGESIYREALDFNAMLRNTKKWANNPWTNWFHNQDIAALDYIDLGMEEH